MGVAEDVPGVRGVDFGEEVVAVADQEARFVAWELGVEEDFGGLRHAADGSRGEMAEVRDGPRVLVLGYHGAAIGSVLKHAEEELGVGFGAVDSYAVQEGVEIVV